MFKLKHKTSLKILFALLAVFISVSSLAALSDAKVSAGGCYANNSSVPCPAAGIIPNFDANKCYNAGRSGGWTEATCPAPKGACFINNQATDSNKVACPTTGISGFDTNKCYVSTISSALLVPTGGGTFKETSCPASTADIIDCRTDVTNKTDCIQPPDADKPQPSSITKCEQFSGGSGGACGLIGYINDAIKILSAVIGIVATGMIIFGGIQYSAAGADYNAVGKAKKTIFRGVFMIIGYGLLFAIAQWLLPGGIL